MIVNSARFEISNTDVRKCPPGFRHEYAFIGRSNVGKSSLINNLTRHKGLAKTSSTPGKTMLINHFLVNDQWYIVDLPGYGYARRDKANRDRLRSIIEGYILYREQMTNLFVLVDIRHKPQKIDLEFMEWCGENGIPFSIVFTKADKVGPVAGKRNVADYCEKLLETWEELPPVFVTSSEDSRGRDALLAYIEQLNRLPILSEQPTNNTETMTDSTPNLNKAQVKAVDQESGASVDVADSEKVDTAEVLDYTKELNNNPRDTDDINM